jgi:hypothetical protein
LPVVEKTVSNLVESSSPLSRNELSLRLGRDLGKLYTLPAKHSSKSQLENRNNTFGFSDKPVKQQFSRRENTSFNPHTEFSTSRLVLFERPRRRKLLKDAPNPLLRPKGTRLIAIEKFRRAIYTVVMLNRLLKTSRAVLIECYENSAVRPADSDTENDRDRDPEDHNIATPFIGIKRQRWLDILQWGLNFSQEVTMRMLLGILPTPYHLTAIDKLKSVRWMDELADYSHFFEPLDNTETKVSALFESVRSVCAAKQGRFAHSESTLDGRHDSDVYIFRGRKRSLRQIKREQTDDSARTDSSVSVERTGGPESWMFDDSDLGGEWTIRLLRSIVTKGKDDPSFHKQKTRHSERTPSPPGRTKVDKNASRFRPAHRASRTRFVSWGLQ